MQVSFYKKCTLFLNALSLSVKTWYENRLDNGLFIGQRLLTFYVQRNQDFKPFTAFIA